MIADYQHGDEYKFVDACADLLDLRGWYVWKDTGAQPMPSLPVQAPPETPKGTTNPELLQSKNMASVMYCLSALQRFEKMERPETFAIATEIALLGQSGIDYADPDRRYHLRSIPDESFSGLQLLALMYVAFKQIDPTVETALDLKDAYQAALQIHEDE